MSAQSLTVTVWWQHFYPLDVRGHNNVETVTSDYLHICSSPFMLTFFWLVAPLKLKVWTAHGAGLGVPEMSIFKDMHSHWHHTEQEIEEMFRAVWSLSSWFAWITCTLLFSSSFETLALFNISVHHCKSIHLIENQKKRGLFGLPKVDNVQHHARFNHLLTNVTKSTVSSWSSSCDASVYILHFWNVSCVCSSLSVQYVYTLNAVNPDDGRACLMVQIDGGVCLCDWWDWKIIGTKTEDEREEEGALVLKKCAQGVDEMDVI